MLFVWYNHHMENNTAAASLAALSPNFTPEVITAHLSPIEELLKAKESSVFVSDQKLSSLLASAISGYDFVNMGHLLDYARDGIERGLFNKINLENVIIHALTPRSSGFREKAEWIQKRGFDIQLSLDSPDRHIKAWATAKEEDVFDWAIEGLLKLPPSQQRRKVFNKILANLFSEHNNFNTSPWEITRRTARRIDIVEQACPGLVREFVSSLPAYCPTPQRRAAEDPVYREGLDRRRRLMVFFLHTMVSGMTQHIADWLDPSRYGTPKSVNTMFEAAVYSLYTPSYEASRHAWIAISRALSARTQAQEYWNKQTRASNLQPIYHDHRPEKERFPSQYRVFGEWVIGRDGRYSVSDNDSPRWDDQVPMNPIGRLLGNKNYIIESLSSTAQGREKIVDTMMSHPAFMAYGFAMFGQDLLSWEQAAKFDGFRDKHGYGAARYALCVCSPITSSFDVVLHRMLRKYKGLCDDASPPLESLFISPSARAKFQAMELRKIASKATRQSEIKREKNSSFRM